MKISKEEINNIIERGRLSQWVPTKQELIAMIWTMDTGKWKDWLCCYDKEEAGFGHDQERQAIDLSGVDFRGINLRGERFYGITFRGANFEGADLLQADFRSTDLREANFRGANLSYASLNWARLAGADFYGAQLDHKTFRLSN